MPDSIDFWHWWVLAIVLVILEVFAPGAFFLWLGVSAGVVGFILWLIPDMGWETQFLIFSVISVLSIALWRFRLRKHPTESEDNTLNSRTAQYVGRVFTLAEPIIDGYGKIHVDDAYWRIAGPDCEAHTKVRVVSADAMVLNVELVDK